MTANVVPFLLNKINLSIGTAAEDLHQPLNSVIKCLFIQMPVDFLYIFIFFGENWQKVMILTKK